MRTPILRELQPTLSGLALAASLLALACSTPAPPTALTDAQAAYRNAESTPVLQQNASVELYEAKQALDRADAEWERDHDEKETAHLVDLANRRLEIAQLWGTGRAALKEGQTLDEQRAAETTKIVSEAESAKQAAAEATAREAKLREELSDLQARETARGLEMSLGDILFDVGQASLKPGAEQRLYPLVTFLKANPDRAALVEGHTDSTGSASFNLTLSEQRAESVQRFLSNNGVEARRIAARGYGKAYPVASNDTSAGRQQNRRVDIVILHPGESPEGKLRPALAAP
jgi:outer membrane protein OmpA-like peptidoglycan-associated protein